MKPISATVKAAVVAGVVSVVTTLGTLGLTYWTARDTLDRQYRLEIMEERAANALLSQPPFRMRSFDAIKYHLAGFDDNDLRRILVRAGAIRWLTADAKEVWGLLEKNECFLSQAPLPVPLNNLDPAKCPSPK